MQLFFFLNKIGESKSYKQKYIFVVFYIHLYIYLYLYSFSIGIDSNWCLVSFYLNLKKFL